MEQFGKISKLGAQSAAKVFFRARLAAVVLEAEDANAVGRHEGENGGKLMICEPIYIEGGQNEVRGERGSDPDAIKILGGSLEVGGVEPVGEILLTGQARADDSVIRGWGIGLLQLGKGAGDGEWF